MDVMRRTQTHNSSRSPQIHVDYLEQTAHSVEVRREVKENGEYGTLGFTLIQEKPSIVGTIVSGGPADRAGLKKKDVVIAVNGNNTTNSSHRDVVNIIAKTQSASIWLTVCEPLESPRSQYPSRGYESSSYTHVSNERNLSSMSQSSPMINRGTVDPRIIYDNTLPKYSEATQYSSRGLTSKPFAASSMNMSPLTKQVFRNTVQQVNPSIQHEGGDFTLYSCVPPSVSQSPGAFTSANVLVLYIGPVEIPNTWKVRELSSRCLQECTRQLLSQRQEFLEVFLEVNLKVLKIMKVDQNVLFQHPREELYYCGVCSDDELYFGIVTKKEQKGLRKVSNGHQPRAHMCHVFKVIKSKSVLILHSGDSKSSPKKLSIQTKSKTIPVTSSDLSVHAKSKTIPITSCVTIINALQGLFTSDDVGGSKLFTDSSSSRGSSDMSLKIAPSSTSFFSTSSGGSAGSSESIMSSDKSKKKLEVVDLRSAAFTPPKPGHQSLLTSSLNLASQNTYVGVNTVPSHSHSLSKEDFSVSVMNTPAYQHQRQGSANSSWYSVDSPKENRHSREGSWDSRESRTRPVSGSYDKYAVQISHGSGSSSGRASGSFGRHSGNIKFDQVRKMSDDSSISSLSDSRASSPAKVSLKSPIHGHSPSPPQSLSYSSGGSRSRSPSPKQNRSPSPARNRRAPRYPTPAVSKLSAGLALESNRLRPSSPSAYVNPRLVLRRQGSENSIMDLQDITYKTTLPAKNTALTSSIGSVATLTTIADEDVNDPEECGRVGGWVASFDKLIGDHLGVQCLLHFLKKEHGEENIMFWRDAQQFKLNISQSQNVQEAVKKIYDQYLAPTSPNTANVDDRVLKGVESKLANPPSNIFNEAQEQIYQLMKMDCYPRFKKSDIVKECLLAEMEGKPLPIDPSPPRTEEETQYNGIWKKHRERGFGRSLFSRFGRKIQQERPQPSSAVWGVSPENKLPELHSGNRKSTRKGNKDDTSPRPKRSSTIKETSKTKHSETVESKAKGSNIDDDDFLPEHHLDMFKVHKRNVFEVNLPNKVTKIMQVIDNATVRQAIQPVLRKYGYTFDMMELKFANTLKLINLDLSADVLIGQHIIVTKSKNTFIAAFPDVLDKILPADGSTSIGSLFLSVLRDMDKLQNYQVYLEGSRVPLELSVDTSVLVGQRVVVKYLPGPYTSQIPKVATAPIKLSKSSLHSSNESGGSGDMDDLFSKIFRLQGDSLSDQRTSPLSTPEPEGTPKGGRKSTSSDDILKPKSPVEARKRGSSNGKQSTSTSELSHKVLSVSKSISALDKTYHSQHIDDRLARGEKERKSERHQRHSNTDNNQTSQDTNNHSSKAQFKRVQSGSHIHHSQREIVRAPNRSASPPGRHRNKSKSPPPPTSKPPPLPDSVKRLAGNTSNATNQRWSATSFKSTDSASSEDSLNADLPRRVRQQRQNGTDHLHSNMTDGYEQLQYFPDAYDQKRDGHPVYLNGSEQEKSRSYQRNRPINLSSLSTERTPRPSMMPSPPRDDTHPLDNVVTEAYVSSQRKSNHPLQNSRGHGQAKNGTNVSSYPWHTAHPPPQQKKGSSTALRSSKERKHLTENPELLNAGQNLVQREIDEFHTHTDLNSPSSERPPHSPSTHPLTMPDDRETFV